MRGFDLKWSLVNSLIFFEGLNGSTVVCDEKTNALIACVNCAISRMSPYFPAGALYFQDTSISRHALSGGTRQLSLGPNVFEIQFALTDWGSSGVRCMFSAENIAAYIDAATHTLYWDIDIDGSGWVSASWVIPEPDEFIGRKHDVRFYLTSTQQFIEVDGVEVARVDHGKTLLGNHFQLIRFGQSGSDGDGWIGYIGSFRWTASDIRPEQLGTPIARHEILAAVDPLREKVVLHLHCEPTSSGLPQDEKGNSIVVTSGTPGITTSHRKYGVGGLEINGGLRIGPNPAFVLGQNDFLLECWLVAVGGASTSWRWLFQIRDVTGGLALGAISRPAFSDQTGQVILGGATAFLGGSLLINTGRLVFLRRGQYLYIFRGDQIVPSTTIDIGEATSISGDGFFHLGDALGEYVSNGGGLVIDEMRLTVSAGRSDGLIYPLPGEKFSNYGPRGLSGFVDDAVGSPVAGSDVAVYHLATGRLVSRDITAADGTFVLPVADSDEHFWVAHKPGKASIIRGPVTPVLIQ